MKNKKIKIGLGIFILFIVGVSIIWIEFNKTRTYELGEVKVEGISGYTIYFKQIYRPMEPRSEIYANILHKNKNIESFVFGTLDFDKIELKHYKAKCKDSIIYILEDSLMIDYYDLKKRKIPFDSIHSYLLKNDKEINKIQ